MVETKTDKKFFNVQVRLNLANYLSKFKLKDKNKVNAVKDRVCAILHMLKFEILNLWNSNSLTRNIFKTYIFNNCSKIAKLFNIQYSEIFQMVTKRVVIQKTKINNSIYN